MDATVEAMIRYLDSRIATAAAQAVRQQPIELGLRSELLTLTQCRRRLAELASASADMAAVAYTNVTREDYVATACALDHIGASSGQAYHRDGSACRS
jgi:hypothetical protein